MFKAWKAYTFYALKFAQFVFKNCTFRFADYMLCFFLLAFWSEIRGKKRGKKILNPDKQ